ncbi:MAG: alpha-ketoacid dehydrogenase subunit beta [Anaerolineae bacterium]|nr:alpha-ketoacid dehydrogenase subunit beta [Anaerolineae bacterium]MDW8101500.1 alpha-ketoacid dehydrogenase subunit beta [Anaerolineae bacterium]
MAERIISMYEAIAEAIAQEMERDPRVFVMGEDVGFYGGIFGATTGLWKKFGDERVRDTPISEMGFVGAAVGAALEGMRPIVEVMFVDFTGACFDQILNHMSKIQYMSGGQLKVPVVLMTAIGGGYNDAAQHSQCLYGLFAHLPGLKIVIPSTPYDAKGLMIQAIRDDNPVMYFFHKGLMGLPWMTIIEATWAPVPEEPYTIPFGVADIKREGKDVTVVAVAMMVHRALEAAQKLEKEGISVEVIDLRTLVPLDREAIINSVKKTHRLLVVDEDYLSYGMSGEIVAIVAENALEYLDAPPKRLAVPDVPIPYSNTLEDFVIPSADRIAEAIKELVS